MFVLAKGFTTLEISRGLDSKEAVGRVTAGACSLSPFDKGGSEARCCRARERRRTLLSEKARVNVGIFGREGLQEGATVVLGLHRDVASGWKG